MTKLVQRGMMTIKYNSEEPGCLFFERSKDKTKKMFKLVQRGMVKGHKSFMIIKYNSR